ncbi:ABC transporter permease [Proteobacteria bacterium 005FR1]|nr:ABC transporter permease [Proteobacteria bacterium 005FR1]
MVFSNILLVFLISLQLGMYQMMINNTLQVFTGHIQLQAPGYLDEPGIRKAVPDIQALARSVRDDLPDVKASARAIGFALASSEQRSYGVQVLGVEPETEAQVSTLPGLIEQGDYLSPRQDAVDQVVIGSVLARNLKIGVGDELTLLGSGRDGSMAADVLTVAGIFESGMPDLDRALVAMPLSRFQETFSMRGAGHAVVIKADEFSQIEAKAAKLRREFGKRDDLVVHQWEELQPGLEQAIQADMASSWFIYGVLVVLVAFSVLNTQLMSVLERTREFGIVMALGLRAGRLARLVLLEAALMALIGLVLGVLLGGLVAAVIGQVGFSYPGLEEMATRFNLPDRMYPEVSLLSVLVGPAIIYFASLLAAVYPALRLFFLQPVTAMRAV